MELVSASKMRKAIQNTVQLRSYSVTAWQILQRVAALNADPHPSLTPRPVKKVLAIVFTSDRGLAGNLNAQISRVMTQYIRSLTEIPTFESVEFIAVGRKGQQFLARTGQHVVAAFPAFSAQPQFKDIGPVSRLALEEFKKGTYDHVTVLYTDFVSPLVQQPTAKVLLPLSATDLSAMIDSLLPMHREVVTPSEPASPTQYQFEPSPEAVIDALLPQITELQIYQALLEATASEHSARMVAMRNATDSANDIIDDLTLTYNQTRQERITGELAELSASKAALD